MRESSVAQRVALEESRLNCLGMRNNVGAVTYIDPDTNRTTHLRFGLMNESKEQNKQVKSSDRILIVPTWCYRETIGWGWLGAFGAIETKPSDWIFSQADQRAVAQGRFHDIVRGYGGFAGFATGPEDVSRIIGRSV